MNPWLKQHGPEWLYRFVVLAGLAAIAWLNSQYASKGDVEKLSERVTGLEIALKVMAESNRVNDRQDTVLKDHEDRLRSLERIPRKSGE